MYLPNHFENTDLEQSLALIRAYPLATVISVDDSGSPFVSHLPLIVEREGDRVACIGHLAHANPHRKLLRDRRATAIFHGPNAYITPTWYLHNAVPTWNYAVVHVSGPVTLIEDRAGIVGCIKALTATVEKGPDAWHFWIPDDLKDRLELSIVGFRMSVETIQSKFKLSQNRSDADRAGVLQGLSRRGDDASRHLVALMKG